MSQGVPELLRQGLIMTMLGMGLVFAALGLLWGIMALLTRIFKDASEEELPQSGGVIDDAPRPDTSIDVAVIESLTAERARVAAIVAGALAASAVPRRLEAPPGPVFEHGRTAPIWVSANRTRALQSWQPPRAAEVQEHAD